jgi:hypothetical protein
MLYEAVPANQPSREYYVEKSRIWLAGQAPGSVPPVLISIVTINLNDAAGLRATAESVVAQRHRERQWLVIDGGSRYVIFMNAGDRFADPTTLTRIVGDLEQAPPPDLLLGGTLLALPSGRKIYRAPRAPTRWLRFGPPAYHQAIVFRRAAHRLVPYDLRLRVSGDYGAVAALIGRGARSRLLEQPLAIRRCDPDSLSERETAVRFADFVRVQRETLCKGWGEIILNLSRLALIHCAYRMVRGGGRPLPQDSLADRSSTYFQSDNTRSEGNT